MNTLVLSVAYLAATQLPPAQYRPDRPVSPAQAESIPNPPSGLGQPGTYRLTDDEQAPPASAMSQSPGSPRQLRPQQNWSPPEPSRATATRAQAQAAVVPVHSTESEALAAMILDGAIEMRAADDTDVALVDLLRRIGDQSSRLRAVQGYWRLCLATAERNFAQHEVRYLSELARPQTELDAALLTAESTRAQARQATAALAVLELQEDLIEIGRLKLNGLPRPVDRPFVGPYATHFEALFANRAPPARLKRINRRLPHQLEVIERSAEAVAAGERASSQLAQAYGSGAAGLSHVLDSLEQLSRSRRELLAAVLSYNEEIAEYSLAVVTPRVAPEALLGTLIRHEEAAPPTMLADTNVRPASAEAPALEPGEAANSRPLTPIAEPPRSARGERVGSAPGTRSILKRVTIDHP